MKNILVMRNSLDDRKTAHKEKKLNLSSCANSFAREMILENILFRQEETMYLL